MKKKVSNAAKHCAPKNDLMETFNVSPWYSVGKIVPTSNQRKEDVFESFRPLKQCVDYKISETWTKMQKGDLKVNVRQTVATYEDIPPELCKPQRKKKLKLFSGGPPQWKFIDEVWREQANECQAQLQAEHKKALRRTNVAKKSKHKSDHAVTQRLVGPEWFMELSPRQLAAVDRLNEAVYSDRRKLTTICCEEVLANLGVVLRPSKNHIKAALQHCCGCPVEFLLVLYQLMNPKREMYCLNDRLLLSAVVHLSITPTLKELHVRIPSPPEEPEGPKAVKKSEKKTKYASPYLEPLTYQPTPPRFSGVYKNKHKQYPENSYFSYIEKLRIEKKCKFLLEFPMFKSIKEMRERTKEYNDAQDFYETLPGVKQEMLELIPPSVHNLCSNFLSPKDPPLTDPKWIAPHLCKVTASEPIVCFCLKEQTLRKKAKISCCEKHAQKCLGSLCLCDDCLEKVRQKNLIRIHGGFQKNPCKCDDPVAIIQGTVQSKTCDCYKEYRNKIVGCAARQRLVDNELKCILGEVVMTRFGPVYNILGVRGPKICLCNEIVLRKAQLKKCKEIIVTNEAKFVIGGVSMTQQGLVFNLTSVAARRPCKCILKYRQQLAVLTVQNKIRQHPLYLVNNGLVGGKYGPIFHFSYVPGNRSTKHESELRTVCSCEIKKTECFERCMNYLEYKEANHDEPQTSESSIESSSDSMSSEERTCPNCSEQSSRLCQQSSESTSSSETTPSSRYKNSSVETDEDYFKPKPCKCKDELERFMKSKCPCEECNRKIRQRYARYVMGGTKTTASGNKINVIQGIQQRLCSCMHNHLENVKKIDEYKSRVKARYLLRKQPKKYLISGVKNTPNGPVYIISGIRPPVECECAKALREKEEKEAFEKQRAKPPNTGRIKYEISGVKAMPGENVYIMSRALNVKPCACEKLLNRFEIAHKSCLDEFEKYICQTQEETSAFVEDKSLQRSVDITFKQGFEIHPSDVLLARTITHEDENAPDEQEKCEPVQENVGLDQTQSDLNCEEAPKSSSEKSSSKSFDETELGDEAKSSDDESSSSSDSTECGSCHVDNPCEITPITIPHHKTLPEYFMSKRFVIFRHMPKCKKTLMKILKYILGGMAEDGFPLARLPQVHKLPIFKLWIELRIGTYWTFEDRLTYQGISKYMWKHTDFCYTHPTRDKLPFTRQQARTMTWKHAELIRDITGKQTNQFYRKLKQVTIDTGREFFSTTFPYEFPTSTWRNCAFAYLPTKEEDLFPYKIVQPHEARNIPNNKKTNCYC